MEEETDLLNSKVEKAVNAVEVTNPTEVLGSTTQMDTTPISNPETQIMAQTQSTMSQTVSTIPYSPPAPTTSFVKTKSKKSKNKNKLVGPVHKDSKVLTQKPYEISSVSKKQHWNEIMDMPPTHAVNIVSLPLSSSKTENYESGFGNPTTHQTCQALTTPDTRQSSGQGAVSQASPLRNASNGEQAALEAVTTLTSLSQ
ncbi:hypothetical protein SLA2020_014860 [Shorea laevis]